MSDSRSGIYDICPGCGQPKAKKAYRCRRCTPLYREAGIKRRQVIVSDTASRYRARRDYELGDCERCGKPGRDLHHRDGDPLNNSPENIASLCRSCHMEIDGRANRLRAFNDERRQDHQPCRICGRPEKNRRHGRCGRCRAYFRRTGKERPVR